VFPFHQAIELCYINGEYSGELERLITEVMEHARTFEDSLVARTTLVKMLGTQDKKKEAMDLALDTLEKMGERFPRKPSRAHVATAHRKVRRLLKGKSDEDILALPPMRNRQKVAAQQMLAQAYLYAAQTSVYLTELFSLRMLELTIEYGISAMSSMGFGVYAVMLSRYVPVLHIL
jgi:histidine kinase